MSEYNFLKVLRESRVDMPMVDIKVGTVFFGNPKHPIGKLPAYSASMGYGTWLKSVYGGATSMSNKGYDGRGDMSTWIIEGYVPADPISLKDIGRILSEDAVLLDFAESLSKENKLLRERISALEGAYGER